MCSFPPSVLLFHPPLHTLSSLTSALHVETSRHVHTAGLSFPLHTREDFCTVRLSGLVARVALAVRWCRPGPPHSCVSLPYCRCAGWLVLPCHAFLSRHTPLAYPRFFSSRPSHGAPPPATLIFDDKGAHLPALPTPAWFVSGAWSGDVAAPHTLHPPLSPPHHPFTPLPGPHWGVGRCTRTQACRATGLAW